MTLGVFFSHSSGGIWLKSKLSLYSQYVRTALRDHSCHLTHQISLLFCNKKIKNREKEIIWIELPKSENYDVFLDEGGFPFICKIGHVWQWHIAMTRSSHDGYSRHEVQIPSSLLCTYQPYQGKMINLVKCKYLVQLFPCATLVQLECSCE